MKSSRKDITLSLPVDYISRTSDKEMELFAKSEQFIYQIAKILLLLFHFYINCVHTDQLFTETFYTEDVCSL